MQITTEWLEAIQDDQGLTRGQKLLLTIWRDRSYFAGWEHIPDQVAHVIETCKGYRGVPEHLRELLHPYG